jgi:hypothetical protein
VEIWEDTDAEFQPAVQRRIDEILTETGWEC